ncbi:poly(ADP-ribose) glycohydrolase isoform X1 [Rhipicephalus sanguineus]|uniref:poly(ADP-ribose) glycohydrolase isoform X1 n=1 Tax=Rhipicephalus sanguineus TaxID=34632 RepID=UPI0020C4C64B|nr:poly(ADP-ribose) glycohydrolase isoform X1 [Rhipicephalus sanguineus]
MSDGVGPSKKRFKQAKLQWFVSAMLEKHPSSNGTATDARKHSSPAKNMQLSDVQGSTEPAKDSPDVGTKFSSDDVEDINSSQELFPELDAADSQVSKFTSCSEETVVDATDMPCESAEHCEEALYCSETESPDDNTIPDSCEATPSSQHSSGSEESIPSYTAIPETFRRTPHCGTRCPPMSRNHTVLCKVVRSESGDVKPCPLIPYPAVPVDKWDGIHVRMPCSPQSKYPLEQGSNGATKLRSRWELIENSLLGPINDSHGLVEAIRQYNGRVSAIWNFKCLHKFFNEELDSSESESFFKVLLPKIVALALRLPALITQPIPLLKCGEDQLLSMSQLQVGCLLANAFFCTFPRRNTLKSNSEYANYPDINFNRLFSGPSDEARKMEKLKCIVNYFRRITKQEPTGMLTFHRRCLTEPYEWSSSKRKLGNLFVSELGFIEREGQGMLQVDFANKFIGGGVLGGGCVQEEIRFMMCPELIVSRLFTEALGSREVLVITGAEQFNATSGYADKFAWKDDFKDEVPRDPWERRCTEVVAMDALCFAKPQEQYRPSNIRRELNKAYCGFFCPPEIPRAERSTIATGNWGCGAFRGDPQLKALIQLMAASVAGRDLVYFTFGDKQLCQRLRAEYNLLTKCGMTVGGLYELLAQYSQHQSPQARPGKFQLFEYLRRSCTP